MTKEIEKSRSAGKLLFKFLAVAAISGALWKLALRLLAGGDNTLES